MEKTLRLDKLLSDSGQWSRKEAKQLLRQGRVQVDGQVERSADRKVCPAAVQVTVDGQAVAWAEHRYLMLWKPAGVLTATEDRRQKTVLDLLPAMYRDLFPVGRLDKDTEGLLLLTDDGALTHRLIHPSHQVEKEYLVWVTGDVDRALPVLSGPMELDGEPLAPAQVRRGRTSGGVSQLSIIIHQGKNRQVRRMCAQAGLTVKRLKRVREGRVTLDRALAPGAWRRLTEAELALLR